MVAVEPAVWPVRGPATREPSGIATITGNAVSVEAEAKMSIQAPHLTGAALPVFLVPLHLPPRRWSPTMAIPGDLGNSHPAAFIAGLRFAYLRLVRANCGRGWAAERAIPFAKKL